MAHVGRRARPQRTLSNDAAENGASMEDFVRERGRAAEMSVLGREDCSWARGLPDETRTKCERNTKVGGASVLEGAITVAGCPAERRVLSSPHRALSGDVFFVLLWRVSAPASDARYRGVGIPHKARVSGVRAPPCLDRRCLDRRSGGVVPLDTRLHMHVRDVSGPQTVYIFRKRRFA